LWKTGRPYGLEVVGDPYEAFAPGAIKHPLRPYLRRQATQSLKEQCERAAAVSYVTERSLQRRYPSQSSFVAGVSDIDLPPSWFRDTPRTFEQFHSNHRPRLLFIGSLEQMYKGQDVLLQAMAQIRKTTAVELRIVGAGRHRQELESLAASLALEDVVQFTGELSSGSAILSELDAATLLVLPSRTEGLPRVIVEAMARALPCIATSVGGIPELLDAEDLIAPGDPNALATKIMDVLVDVSRLNRMSARNMAKSESFRPEALEERRTDFYSFLRDATEDWLHARRAVSARVA
jgi:glycosyltransferase involved in cell wall biosynthesis